jgi:hypothetical protein
MRPVALVRADGRSVEVPQGDTLLRQHRSKNIGLEAIMGVGPELFPAQGLAPSSICQDLPVEFGLASGRLRP